MGGDFHLASLYHYEREQDHADRMDRWLAEIEAEIWDDGELLESAIQLSSPDESVDDAVSSHARRVMNERIRDAETARAESSINE